MAGKKNQVTLTFAGDTQKLESAFDQVGSSARNLGTEVGQAGQGFDRAGEAADNLDTKAMGFRDTLTGVQDTMKGTSQIAEGDLFNGFLTLGMGVGDLGSGMFNFLIPALKAARLSMLTTGIAALKTAGQFALSWAIALGPIALLVAAVAGLGFVVIKNWDTIWSTTKRIGGMFVGWFKAAPGLIRDAFSGLVNIITWPYRTAFNLISRAWNNTVGQLRWTVPGWVPLIGGNTVGAPKLPTFHQGGIASGAMGGQFLAMLRAGEQVTPSSGPPSASIGMTGGGTALEQLLAEFLHHAVRIGLIQLSVDGQPVAVAGG